MTWNSPFDHPSYKKKTKKKKKKKKVSKKKRRAKKATKKVAKKKKNKAKKRVGRQPTGPSPRPSCPIRAKGQKLPPSETIRVSKAELEKLRKSVAKPTWTDLLPESKRKVFTYKRKRYFPLYSLLYMISAVEVPKGFKPRAFKRGELLKAHRVHFVQRGSLIDV
jgi:hypothetical protein